MSKSKQKGTAAETAVVKYLKANGFPKAERRALQGSLDKGDISGIPGVTIEIKNHAKMDLAGWTEELIVEMANDKAWTGVVWHKRKGRGSPGDWYCTMPAHVWVDLLRRALGEAKH